MKQQSRHGISLGGLVAIATVVAVGVFVILSTTLLRPAKAWSITSLPISQMPLTVTTSVHPQILIAIGNSQSLDGTLAGAIMPGSGSLSSDLTSLNNSSSPATY